MDDKKEYIAYQGQAYTIEWFYTRAGYSPALEYYQSLDAKSRMKVLYLFKRMGDHGKINDITKFNYEGDQVYAFKPQPERFLCFFVKEQKIIITNGFRKKQQKLPIAEKSKALHFKEDYEQRMQKEDYYD